MVLKRLLWLWTP
ncbi:hypothetical protein TCSYLVIO_010299, partial [Trypanosoma cruzi]